MKSIQIVVPALLACLLAACGGGEDNIISTAGGTTSTTTGDSALVTGSVSAPFVAGVSPRYFLFGVGSQRFGRLSTSKQAANGAMTTINDSVLSGATVVNEVSGDAAFAQGRWAGGLASTSSGAATLTGNAAYHYITYNALNAVFPASGALVCDAGMFTAPTYIGGGTGTFATSGTATGQAAVTFSSAGAFVTGAVTGAANGATSAITLNTTLADPSGTGSTGNLFGSSAGAVVAMGDAGGGNYLVLAAYALGYPSGARYQGVATFHCR
ncbi:MAG: hypothetical protein EOO28_28975 [Comamonadaceae bacterium]|nr:MAG: hypothetical protein EOO28_28975 [Comamonadaceae bacterium]